MHSVGIEGGAVYDVLVGACAGLTFATPDGRALDTYDALGVRTELIG